jgi:hypothetical protein
MYRNYVDVIVNKTYQLLFIVNMRTADSQIVQIYSPTKYLRLELLHRDVSSASYFNLNSVVK